MKQITLTGLMAVFGLVAARAEISLSPVFTDNMVLQRNALLPVWGRADAGETVSVEFAGQTKSAVADSDGNWKIIFDPLTANARPEILQIKGVSSHNPAADEQIQLTNLLVGEVWICSGQSNMRFMLRQSTGGNAEAARANDPLLRLFDMVGGADTSAMTYNGKEFTTLHPDHFFTGSWQRDSPDSAAKFSAVGYLVGKKLRETLHVPVGLICNAIGGSPAAAWFPPEIISSRPEYASFSGADWLNSPHLGAWVKTRARENLGTNVTANHPFKPAFLFESGVRCLTPMAVAGCLWYQGESDAELTDSAFNKMVLTDLITGWRHVFGQENLPFFMVQLPRINDPAPLRAGWPQFREMQANVAARISNVFNCVTIDLGTTTANVHPPDKRPVAERLANLVCEKIYGEKIAAESPTLDRFAVKGGTLTVWFRNGAGLVTTDGAAPREFQIAGGDGNFYDATATIRADGGVDLKSPEVAAPMAVRYDWAVFVNPNLQNAAGLPVAPFRTDDGAVVK